MNAKGGEVPQDIEVLEQALSQLNDGFVSGALRSDYQKPAGANGGTLGRGQLDTVVAPVRPRPRKGMVEQGFEIMITGVSAEG